MFDWELNKIREALLAFTEEFKNVAERGKLYADGFLIRVPDYYASDFNLPNFLRQLLNFLSKEDPVKLHCMEDPNINNMEKKWSFSFNDVTFFLVPFSPYSSETSPRELHAVDKLGGWLYILFQPEEVFNYRLPKDKTERRKKHENIRQMFIENEKPYSRLPGCPWRDYILDKKDKLVTFDSLMNTPHFWRKPEFLDEGDMDFNPLLYNELFAKLMWCYIYQNEYPKENQQIADCIRKQDTIKEPNLRRIIVQFRTLLYTNKELDGFLASFPKKALERPPVEHLRPQF